MTSGSPFGDVWRGRRVLVTGHTGFKGAWLATWLLELGADVTGLALDPPTSPSAFGLLGLADDVRDLRVDVRDASAVREAVAAHRPSVVLHLAAEAIVRHGWAAPLDMFATNVMGTANVVDAALRTPDVDAVVAVTTDKVYDNVEWAWGYRENDRIGGHDPYAASKAGSELAVRAWRSEGLQSRVAATTDDPDRRLPVVSARAGNVIGGGDFAPDRIVPDLVRAVVDGSDLVLRNPGAVRPWQHVLEPLSGYLLLARELLRDPSRVSPAYNIGPSLDTDATTVEELVRRLLAAWPDHATSVRVEPDAHAGEAHLLTLDSTLARTELGWRPAWDLDVAVAATADWYGDWRAGASSSALRERTVTQATGYVRAAAAAGIAWSVAGEPDDR